MRKGIFAFLALLVFMSGWSGDLWAEPFRGPWGKTCVEAPSGEEERKGFNPLRGLVQLHRKYISPIDGKECPMHPSCSEYSLLCFEKHGFFMGWIMTCDRLLHEGDEMRKGPVVLVDGAQRYYDPLENNDFWWDSDR